MVGSYYIVATAVLGQFDSFLLPQGDKTGELSYLRITETAAVGTWKPIGTGWNSTNITFAQLAKSNSLEEVCKNVIECKY